ncbi:hypothetical protein HN865_01715 [Candidatus Woesearchaeota archaeon]|jgi:hypothetical protein|nr:hypothetical protein [Candidatus Woesearchaeota archaeon]MBT7237553.1 hypothetical protein [Candidatus Woesearchaeota archaeon]
MTWLKDYGKCLEQYKQEIVPLIEDGNYHLALSELESVISRIETIQIENEREMPPSVKMHSPSFVYGLEKLKDKLKDGDELDILFVQEHNINSKLGMLSWIIGNPK